MQAGRLRIAYWALDERGERAECLATVEQRADAGFDPVFTADPRAVDAVLELRDGDRWRPVRTRRDPGGGARVLTPP